MRRLNEKELADARALLHGPDGRRVLDAVFDLAVRSNVTLSPDLAALLTEAGWLEQGSLTELGELIRDPLREYGYWVRRDRRLPSEELVPALELERYRGKRVLELGSGGGCNLFSIARATERAVGVEPMPLYAQVGSLLAALEGLPAPPVVQSVGSCLPFASHSFDRVLCYSSHQYMNVHVAIAEASRVLVRGGELVMVGNSLGPFIFESGLRFLRGLDLGTAKYDTTAIVNTLTYQWVSRRVIKSRDARTTSMPIYPSLGYMRRRLAESGLRWDEAQTRTLPSGETALVASKVITVPPVPRTRRSDADTLPD